jgi:hypothetical protein
MENDRAMVEALHKDFSVLTEQNRRKAIDMAKFLVLTQNAVIPTILTEKIDNPEKKGSDGIGL